MKTWSPAGGLESGVPVGYMVPDEKGQWVSLRSARTAARRAWRAGFVYAKADPTAIKAPPMPKYATQPPIDLWGSND